MSTEAAAAEQAGTAPRARTRKARPQGRTPWWMWLGVAAIVIFCLFPFYWLINISLKTGNDLQSSSLVPPHPTLSNYSDIFQNPDFTKALRNSAVVALVTTLLALTVGSFCAYALARLKLQQPPPRRGRAPGRGARRSRPSRGRRGGCGSPSRRSSSFACSPSTG